MLIINRLCLLIFLIRHVGLRYLAGDISGGNARCIAMLQAFQESIKEYSTPPEKALIRDLTTKINGNISFLIGRRPLSISMGNAISLSLHGFTGPPSLPHNRLSYAILMLRNLKKRCCKKSGYLSIFAREWYAGE